MPVATVSGLLSTKRQEKRTWRKRTGERQKPWRKVGSSRKACVCPDEGMEPSALSLEP